jgi:hypothetical protein
MSDNTPAPDHAEAVAPDPAAPPAGELTALQARVQAAEQERDRFLNLARQAQADFEN